MSNEHENDLSPHFSDEANAALTGLDKQRIRRVILAAQVAANARGASEVSAIDVEFAIAQLANEEASRELYMEGFTAVTAVSRGRKHLLFAAGTGVGLFAASFVVLLARGSIEWSNTLLTLLTAIGAAFNAIVAFVVVSDGRRRFTLSSRRLESERRHIQSESDFLSVEVKFLSSWRRLEEVLYRSTGQLDSAGHRRDSLGSTIEKYATLNNLSSDDVIDLRKLVQLRNNLVHGTSNRPTISELNTAVSMAEHFMHIGGKSVKN